MLLRGVANCNSFITKNGEIRLNMNKIFRLTNDLYTYLSRNPKYEVLVDINSFNWKLNVFYSYNYGKNAFFLCVFVANYDVLRQQYIDYLLYAWLLFFWYSIFQLILIMIVCQQKYIARITLNWRLFDPNHKAHKCTLKETFYPLNFCYICIERKIYFRKI